MDIMGNKHLLLMDLRIGRRYSNSFYNVVKRLCEELMNQFQHTQKVLDNFTFEQIIDNRLRLKVSIDTIQLLAFQVLDKALKNASYTSPKIQKEILHIFSTKVKNAIREEFGDAKYCIIVDETRDELKNEQMAIVLRFVDKDDIQNIRRQRYDGASNMRALVAASKAVIPIHKFFPKLTFVFNIVGASCKRNDELKVAQAVEIEHMIDIDKLETGKGLNQIGTLQRARHTCWSSHFKLVSSLIKIFSPTCEVLLNIINEGTTFVQRGDTDSAYEALTSFEFVFILHLIKEMLEITDLLCHALQSSTKAFLQKFREDKWDALLANMKSFCKVCNIDVPNMNVPYIRRRCRARDHQDDFTVEHYYRVDIFYATIDSQLQELNG
ncbi:uncharacterized protein LOC114256096 [Camellia sinensis]|uniref:uncharacterized protein LOC114256096 n=1 Tax=Camellia sinensis TaxID=4442 RepID=UPI0010360030|nr:uncharacterized protein LOC114256096 [Camellia sinensis]